MNSDQFVVWLANAASMTVILGFIYTYVIRPVNQKLSSVEKMQETVEAINAELHPNGGASIKDALTRVETQQVQYHEDVVRLEGKMDGHIDFHLREK